MSAAPASKDGADTLIRWSTVFAVTAVAGVAAWVSYRHALAVVRAYGEGGAVGQVYPITIDGLIYAASMVLLDSARRGRPAPSLAYWLLGCGISATVAANVAAGAHSGPFGMVVGAWPAGALVGSYELLMLIIRSSAGTVAIVATSLANDGQAPTPTVATVANPVANPVANHLATIGSQVVTGADQVANPVAKPLATDAAPLANLAANPPVATVASGANPVVNALASQVASAGQVTGPDAANDGDVATAKPAATPKPKPLAKLATVDLADLAKLANDPAARTRQAATANPGKSNDELAAMLGISARSVRRHLATTGAANGHALPGINGHDLTAPTP